MPEIRPFVASESVTTGVGGARASSDSFDESSGAASMASGIYSITDTMARLGAKQAQEKKRLKEQQDLVWVGETVESERRAWMDFMAQPDNVQDPNISDKFLNHAKGRIAELSSTAPSKEASAVLRLRLGSTLTSNYGEAIDLGRRASLSRLGQSFDQRAAIGFTAYRSGGQDSMLVETLTTLRSDVDATVGKISKEAATKLKSQYELDGIYAAIDTSPEFAKKMIANSTMIDERQRSMLLRQANEASSRVDAEQRWMFDQQRADARARWAAGVDFGEIPLSSYERVYAADVARAHKRDDDQVLGIYRGASEEYATIQEKVPFYQGKHLDHLAQTIGGESDAKKYEILARKVEQSARLFDRDPVAWLMTNNRSVQAATNRARSVTPEERATVLTERANILLRLQGPAPEGDTSGMYADLPEHRRSLLTVQEAEDLALRVNAGKPSEAIATFDQLMAQYNDPRLRVIAFNDMVRLPKNDRGVRQELQLVIQNRNAWWIGSYIGAITQNSGVRQLSTADAKEFEDKLTGNLKWSAFQRGMIGDNFQRADELAGFKRGIISFANSLTLGGSSSKDAVNKAVDMLLGETLGVATVNNRPLIVPKKGSDKNAPARSDDEIVDIGRRLSVALSFVDPAKVDDSFMNLGELKRGDIARFQAVRDQITAYGFFQPNQDGQGAALFVSDNLGNPIAVKDHRGRQFIIRYDDLPSMVEKRVIPGATGYLSDTSMAPIAPKTTYNLMEDTGSDILGTTEVRSFWPIQPNWIRNE